MRRRTGLVLAFLLALLGAPAAYAASGEVVLVADGPSYGTLTLPARAEPQWDRARLTSGSPYVLLAATQRGRVATVGAMLVGADPGVAWFGQGALPSGRSTVRVLVRGKATIRVPVTGVAGRRTVRLRNRLPDTIAVLRTPEAAGASVEDDIPFLLPRTSVILHGVTARHQEPVAGAYSFCVAEGDDPCPRPEARHAQAPMSALTPNRRPGGYHAYVSHTEAGIGPLEMRHYVLALPTA